MLGIRNWLKRPGRREWMVLITLLFLAGAAWVFLELVDYISDGETHVLDEQLLLSMRNADDLSDPIGPKWVEELGRDITALGGMGILTLLTVAVIGYLLLEHKVRIAVFVVIAVGGGILISSFLKTEFDRPRPDLVPHESYVYTKSFPSGHSMLSAVTYLTLAALLAHVQERRRVKYYVMGLAVLVTIGVGISRVYMGVHWPTDVLAGWSLGAAWALICWLIGHWLQHRGHVEKEGVEPELAREGGR